MREFLRGGYKDVTEMTVVANHGRPVFIVNPVGMREPAPSTQAESVLRSGSGDGATAPPRSAGVPEA